MGSKLVFFMRANRVCVRDILLLVICCNHRRLNINSSNGVGWQNSELWPILWTVACSDLGISTVVMSRK